nr:MAG TPA: hypothetical protein [Caudoviricetes sp.]
MFGTPIHSPFPNSISNSIPMHIPTQLTQIRTNRT